MSTTMSEEWRPFAALRRIDAVVDFAAASPARAAAVLVVLALLNFLPGFFGIPPVDRDEARFAQATKQMIESADYIDIRFQDEVRYKKPVGIYWLQAAVVRTAQALGVPDATTRIWLYRIPSLVGAVGAVLMTFWIALAFGRPRTAVLAAMMVAWCVLLGVEARLAKTDAMLLFTVTAAMGALARVYLNRESAVTKHAGWILPAIFWTALAGGILLKGPLIVMVTGLAATTLSVLDRSGRWLGRLRPAVGIVWTTALVLPWFIAIAGRTGDSFFVESVGGDLLSKLFSGQEAHGAPPGYYLLLFWLTFWPAAPLAFVAAPAIWRNRHDPGIRFLLAWLVPAWITFELIVTKLPHYVLPVYPAVAILIGLAMERQQLSTRRWLVRGTLHWPVIAAILAIGAVIILIVVGKQLGLLAWPFAAGAAIVGFFAWRLYALDGAERSLLRAGVAAMLTSFTVFGLVLPLLQPLFPSAQAVESLDTDCDQPLFAAAGYQEPSLVFLLGTSTELLDGAGAADFLSQGRCRYALVEAREERSFARRAEAIGLRYFAGPRIEGINASIGRAVTLAVFRSVDAP